MYNFSIRRNRSRKKGERDEMNIECARAKKNKDIYTQRQTDRHMGIEKFSFHFFGNENTHDIQMEHTLLFSGYCDRFKSRINYIQTISKNFQVRHIQTIYIYIRMCAEKSNDDLVHPYSDVDKRKNRGGFFHSLRSIGMCTRGEERRRGPAKLFIRTDFHG